MVNVAILGFGTVGSGVAEVLTKNGGLIDQRADELIRLKYILDVRDFPDSPYRDRFVKDFSLLDEKQLPELVVWEKYLVYAMLMGRADELAKQLPLRYPQFADDAYMQNHFVYFYVFSHHGSGLDGFSRSFESISGAISGTISNAFVSSSGSGSGGGFSGGGGGGFGGGGGGFK